MSSQEKIEQLLRKQGIGLTDDEFKVAVMARFDGIDERLDRIETDFSTLKTDVSTIKALLQTDAEAANIATVGRSVVGGRDVVGGRRLGQRMAAKPPETP